MPNDCEQIRVSSSYVAKWVSRQPAVKEESLTDWLLFDLSTRISRIHYIAFSRHQEARETGADWEWWFLYPKQTFRMRVQAKRLFYKKDHYSGIAYTNKHGLQIEKLLTDAVATNSIPLYAFLGDGHNGKSQCKGGFYGEGVYIAGANTVYNTYVQPGKAFVESKDLISLSVPLSCFICCPYSRNGTTLDVFLQNYFASELVPTENAASDLSRGMYPDTPHHILNLVEHSIKDEVPEWWEQEFSREIEGINGISVYDARQDINEGLTNDTR